MPPAASEVLRNPNLLGLITPYLSVPDLQDARFVNKSLAAATTNPRVLKSAVLRMIDEARTYQLAEKHRALSSLGVSVGVACGTCKVSVAPAGLCIKCAKMDVAIKALQQPDLSPAKMMHGTLQMLFIWPRSSPSLMEWVEVSGNARYWDKQWRWKEALKAFLCLEF